MPNIVRIAGAAAWEKLKDAATFVKDNPKQSVKAIGRYVIWTPIKYTGLGISAPYRPNSWIRKKHPKTGVTVAVLETFALVGLAGKIVQMLFFDDDGKVTKTTPEEKDIHMQFDELQDAIHDYLNGDSDGALRMQQHMKALGIDHALDWEGGQGTGVVNASLRMVTNASNFALAYLNNSQELLELAQTVDDLELMIKAADDINSSIANSSVKKAINTLNNPNATEADLWAAYEVLTNAKDAAEKIQEKGGFDKIYAKFTELQKGVADYDAAVDCLAGAEINNLTFRDIVEFVYDLNETAVLNLTAGKEVDAKAMAYLNMLGKVVEEMEEIEQSGIDMDKSIEELINGSQYNQVAPGSYSDESLDEHWVGLESLMEQYREKLVGEETPVQPPVDGNDTVAPVVDLGVSYSNGQVTVAGSAHDDSGNVSVEYELRIGDRVVGRGQYNGQPVSYEVEREDAGKEVKIYNVSAEDEAGNVGHDNNPGNDVAQVDWAIKDYQISSMSQLNQIIENLTQHGWNVPFIGESEYQQLTNKILEDGEFDLGNHTININHNKNGAVMNIRYVDETGKVYDYDAEIEQDLADKMFDTIHNDN